MEERRKPPTEQEMRKAAERLAEIGVRLQRHHPEEVESWLAERYTDKQTRQLLVGAMILLVELKMFSDEEDEATD